MPQASHRWTAFALVIGLFIGAVGALMFKGSRQSESSTAFQEALSSQAGRKKLSSPETSVGVEDRHRVFTGLARKFGLSDPAAGWEYGMGMKNVADRAEFMASLLQSWASKDPEASLNKAINLGMGRLKTTCVAAACAGWASRDPLAAAKWVESTLSGSPKAEASAAIAAAWAESSPETATAWAAALPPGLCWPRIATVRP